MHALACYDLPVVVVVVVVVVVDNVSQTSCLSLCGYWCGVGSHVQRSRPSICGVWPTLIYLMGKVATTSLP